MKIYINLIILQEYIFILVGLNFKLKIDDVWYEILHEFNYSTRIHFYFGGIKFQVKNSIYFQDFYLQKVKNLVLEILWYV